MSSEGPANLAAPHESADPIGVDDSDPRRLIERSRVQRTGLSGWPLLAIAGAAVLILVSPSQGPLAGAFRVAGPLVMIGVWTAISLARRRFALRLQAETQAVVALEELIQLRRWPEALHLAVRLLSTPMVLPDRRLTALMNLATVYSRYHRFDDALTIHEYLLNAEPGEPQPDGPTSHAIRVARAMAMLREDHLVDADRAMNDLRREVNRARDEVRRQHGTESAASIRSAGLALLDLYRDVKTHHNEEAVRGFEENEVALRDQLGIRVADAWVLVAAARHALGDADGARTAYFHATTLMPAIELHRRYPETATLKDVYPAAQWPAAVAA